jgi:hypothetical protein
MAKTLGIITSGQKYSDYFKMMTVSMSPVELKERKYLQESTGCIDAIRDVKAQGVNIDFAIKVLPLIF